MIDKVLFCIKQGIELGWLLDSEDESVMIFQPNQLPEIVSGSTVLPVLEGLGNWTLTVQAVFEGLRL